VYLSKVQKSQYNDSEKGGTEMTYYTDVNFKTKKALKDAVKRGDRITVFPAGLGTVPANGSCSICGPWYPEPHRWYALVWIKNGLVDKVS
jgi:hypothetical protein